MWCQTTSYSLTPLTRQQNEILPNRSSFHVSVCSNYCWNHDLFSFQDDVLSLPHEFWPWYSPLLVGRLHSREILLALHRLSNACNVFSQQTRSYPFSWRADHTTVFFIDLWVKRFFAKQKKNGVSETKSTFFWRKLKVLEIARCTTCGYCSYHLPQIWSLDHVES